MSTSHKHVGLWGLLLGIGVYYDWTEYVWHVLPNTVTQTASSQLIPNMVIDRTTPVRAPQTRKKTKKKTKVIKTESSVKTNIPTLLSKT